MKVSPSKIRVDVICKECFTIFDKRKDSLKGWKGHCLSCAQKIEKQNPELKKRMSILSRDQVLRQGGIPNARKFTTENSSGSNSSTWQGGITPENMKIRLSSKMQEWRKEVLKRDDYTCRMCNQRGGDKEVDHIKPFAVYIDLRFDLENGRTLCKPCHRTYGAKVLHGKVIREAILIPLGR